MSNIQKITLIGGGLVGSLLALLLQKKGFQVSVYERRSDPRVLKSIGKVGEGRSINLAISVRGFYGLEQCGLKELVQSRALPMLGRMLHQKTNENTFQAYGQKKEDAIYSFSRNGLNTLLMENAEKAGVQFYFNKEVQSVDLNSKKIKFAPDKDGIELTETEADYELLIGTDGSASVLRNALEKKSGVAASSHVLSHGYKELLMPALPDGNFALDKNALHIWPRGHFMLIGLPNEDGSFTCTLFMPMTNQNATQESFESIQKNIQAFFEENFLDFTLKTPNYLQQFQENPIGRMVTIKTTQWSDVDSACLLLGDASHAIVPFFGQGMNCGFEDCVEFMELIEKYDLANPENWSTLFSEFYKKRKSNTDAIADLAIENFTEMSALTADPRFLLEKKIESKLYTLFSEDYIPRYTLVSFSRTPYRIAYEIGLAQKEILSELSKDFLDPMALETQMDIAKELIQKKLKPTMDLYKEHIKWN